MPPTLFTTAEWPGLPEGDGTECIDVDRLEERFPHK